MFYLPVYRIALVRERSLPLAPQPLSNPPIVAQVLWQHLSDADREHFVVLLVNAKNKLIGINTVSIGSLNTAPAEPREVFKPAVTANAFAVILGHNHPSGEVTPSRRDRELTRRLVEAGRILNIRVLDHVIVGSQSAYYSFAERGEL